MKQWFIIGAIIILSASLRLYRINDIPHGLSWDEASFIYNGWSISLWHRDEFANFMPLAFKSYGDYKPPFIFYLLAATFKITGLIPAALRFYSSLSGILTTVLMMILAHELFNKNKPIIYLVGILTAVTPWAVHFSRLGFEANFAVPCVILTMLALVKTNTNPKWWLIAAISSAASFYIFHNSKIVIPLVIIGWLMINKKQIMSGGKIKTIAASLMLLFVLSLPIIQETVVGHAGDRGRQTLIFFENNKLITNPTKILTIFLTNLENQLSPAFWINGYDAISIRHNIPKHGSLFKVEFIGLIMGIYTVVARRRKIDKLFLIWLFAGLSPALLAQGTPHAVRSLLSLPPVILLITLGYVNIYNWFRKKRSVLTKPAIILFAIVMTIELMSFLKYYYTTYAIDSAAAFQYGYEQAIGVAEKILDKDKIVLTDYYGQPYIYVLLTKKITPQQFQFGALSTYDFRPIHWPETGKNIVYIASPQEISPNDPATIETVTIPNSDIPIFVIAKSRK